MIRLTNKTGQAILGLLIVMGLMAILLPALLTGLYTARTGKVQQSNRIQAVATLSETQTALKNIRDQDWNFVSTNGTYYPSIDSGNWVLISGSQTLSGFTKQLVIEDVYRDVDGNIVTSSGILDPSTKKITLTVTWGTPMPTTVEAVEYLTRHGSLSYTETTQTHFNAVLADRTNVRVQSSAPLPTPTPNDGEIVLSQTGGFGDWCNPALTFSSLDLPKSGVANAVSAITTGGQAAAVTGDNASGVAYANIAITDPAYPTAPIATKVGEFDGFKTNGVFTEENYAYITTDTVERQVVIIDLTNIVNGKYNNNVPYGWLNFQVANVNGTSVYVSNNIAYVTATNNKLYTFDISNRSGAHTPIGSVNLAGVGKKIVVVGNNAYIAVNSTTNQLQIVDVSNPASMPVPTSITVNGNGAVDVFTNVPQSRAYLVTTQSNTKPEFFLINLATNTVLGSYDTDSDGNGNMNPKGVVAVSGAKVILVGVGGREYEVLRVDGAYENNPAYCGGLNIDTGVNGISTVFRTTTNRAFSYLVTGEAGAEFKVIEGGPGGTGSGNYVPTGTFISPPFGPTTNDTFFNSFEAHFYQPVVNVGTGFYGIQMQVAVAAPVNGNCTDANYTFVGTDASGTSQTTYFTTTATGSTNLIGTIPFSAIASYSNPNKCFKYKVVLNTNDSTLTPVFRDITINYSP